MGVQLAVFTKPWKMPLHELGEYVADLGFDAVELPVRPGYQVEPDSARKKLPEAVRVLASFGVKVVSIASVLEEDVFAACGENGIPILRHMVSISDDGYLNSEARTRAEFRRLIPLLDKFGVTLGIQNHCGRMVSNASGLRTLLEGFDKSHIAAIWDAAHQALCGEEPELALDIVWPHLCMVNLKNAYWKANREGDGAQTHVTWAPYWTVGKQGLASWPRVIASLGQRAYQGPICLTAEYSEEDKLAENIATDVKYVKELLAATAL